MKEQRIADMDLDQIAGSGQCFLWRSIAPGKYGILSRDNYVEVLQDKDRFSFSCGEEEFDSVWAPYFDLDTDYGAVKRRVDPGDACLAAAVGAGWGIRILRQDLWEVMVSFLISQNNNIARISRSVEQLCLRYGSRCPSEGTEVDHYYAFPTPDQLCGVSLEEFQEAGLGYRAKYLAVLAESMRGDGLERFGGALREADEELMEELLTSLYGVGKKVAQCVMLYGLHCLNAFPVDTHIKKALERNYSGGFPFERYEGVLGVIQQYLFYSDLGRGENGPFRTAGE